MKLDIAEVEANAQKVRSAFESINVGIVNTGDVITGLLSGFQNLDAFDKNFIESQVRQERELRQKEFEMQAQLTEAQIAYMAARQAALERGDPLITVSGDGLAPHLEGFMFAVFEGVKTRITETQGDFLLGI